MKGYRTKAFVLRKMNLGEADQIITLYTFSNGKVKAIAKGVRKPQSRNVGNLELLNLIDVLLIPGKSFEIITQVKVEDSFQTLKKDLASLASVYYLLEIVDKFAMENEENVELFNLFKDFLEQTVNNHGFKNSFNLNAFEFKLVGLLGFAPELFHCVKCHQKLIGSRKQYFSNALGGVVCENCRNVPRSGAPPRAGEIDNKLSENSIKILRFILQNDLNRINKIITTSKDKEIAKKIITNYLTWVLERQLKTPLVTREFFKV